jgi:CubicO group peptidase (beta-lactamase class C family)
MVILLLVIQSKNTSSITDSAFAAAIDEYLRPYVQSNNFSGSVLVRQHGRNIFQKSYGFADREQKVLNTSDTRFHIASMSMQFTAAAVLRLVDQGLTTLDTQVCNIVPGISSGEKISIRHLLTERSGLPDINELPDYGEVLNRHQTPESLVAKIANRPLLFEPGAKFLHEEHSAYNLLALIVEKKTGRPFATALKQLVFEPMGLTTIGVDDDSPASSDMAKGYEPEGVEGIKPAQSFHWSAKTGNASIYATPLDEALWVDALFNGNFLKRPSRDAVLDTSQRIGYGWFKAANARFNETAYYMNGRAPGFASFVLYLPREQATIVLFSNIYSSATTTIGNDIAAIFLNLPYEPFRPSDHALTDAELKASTGIFQFGPDFYQANAQVTLIAEKRQLAMRWPSGDISPLISLERDHFIDRSYWQDVKIERHAFGLPTRLIYDHFEGKPVTATSDH